MTQIIGLFAGHGLKFAAVFGMLAMIGTWDWRRIRQAENRGAESVRVETRKANDAAVSTADKVRARVNAGGVRGKRDPYTSTD